MKGEQKETKKNKRGLYMLALCGVLAASGIIYAGTLGRSRAKPERNLVDLNEESGKQSGSENKNTNNPGSFVGNPDAIGESIAGNSEDSKKGDQMLQKPDGENSASTGNLSNGSDGLTGKANGEATENEKLNDKAAENEKSNAGATENEKPKTADGTQKPKSNTGTVRAEKPEQSFQGESNSEKEISGKKDETGGAVTPVMNPTAEELKFSEEEGLCWPLQGNVIKNYSTDQMVYFETLQQFRTNPAIFISGEIGSDIVAATDGIVKEIQKEDKKGHTLMLDIGEGYLLVYGHLTEITVKEGDYLKVGEVFAKLAPVTKYYQMEGNHLYFQVLKADEPMNPMMLIR